MPSIDVKTKFKVSDTTVALDEIFERVGIPYTGAIATEIDQKNLLTELKENSGRTVNYFGDILKYLEIEEGFKKHKKKL